MTSTVPHQALYRRWRAQTFGEIVGQEAVVETLRNAVRTGRVAPRDPVRRAARDRQDVARPDPRQGRQLHRPAGRRPVRPLPVVRLDPRGHARSTSSRSTPRATAASTTSASLRERLAYPPGRPQAQGLHPRRGPPDHEGRLERAPQVARGAARLRRLHVRLDRAVGVPAGDPVAPPALRRPPADGRRDRGQARPDPRRRRPGRPTRPRSTSSRGSPPAGCATPSRCSTSCSPRRPSAIDEAHGPRPARPGRRRGRRRRSSTPSSTATRRPAIALLDALEERGRDLRRAARPGGRRDPRRAHRRASPIRPRRATIRPPSPLRPGGSRRSTRTGPASAACASSSSSPCSRRAGGSDAAPSHAPATARAPPVQRPRATRPASPIPAATPGPTEQPADRTVDARTDRGARRRPGPPPRRRRPTRPDRRQRRPRSRPRRRNRPQPSARSRDPGGADEPRRCRRAPPDVDRLEPRPLRRRRRRPRAPARCLAGEVVARLSAAPADQAADPEPAGRSRSTARS